jgi:hypothetical protein
MRRILILSTFALANPVFGQTNIQSVTLSTAGIAMIEASGHFGAEPLRLSLRRDDIDDFLKSLWVIDPAHAVPQVSMPGSGAFNDVFDGLPISPQSLTDPAQLLSAMVGANLSVDRRGTVTQGVNMGVAQRPCEFGNCPVLSLLSDDGQIQQIILDDATSFRFTDAADAAMLGRALNAFRTSANPRQLAVQITSDDVAERDVGLVYLQEAPFWRTAWRAVDTAEGLQLTGWAVVENTTGQDWDAIELTLATGSIRSLEARLYERINPVREQASAPEVLGDLSSSLRGALALAAPAPVPMARAMGDSFSSASVSMDDGQSFSRFTLNTPVTLEAGAMISLPFLSQTLPGARVLLFRGQRGATHPMIALRLENPLSLRLPAGVLTLYENERGHAGDANIPEMAPLATETVEFAEDTAVNIREDQSRTERVTEMRISRGVLMVTEDLRRSTTYRIEGAADTDRDITIEQPRDQAWQLETAAPDSDLDYWRWIVPVGANDTAELVVAERQARTRRIGLIDLDANMLMQWVRNAPDDASRQMLDQLLQLRQQRSNITMQSNALLVRERDLATEQRRLVDLIVALGDDSTANRDRRTRVDQIDAEITQAQVTRRDLVAQDSDVQRQIEDLIAG